MKVSQKYLKLIILSNLVRGKESWIFVIYLFIYLFFNSWLNTRIISKSLFYRNFFVIQI